MSIKELSLITRIDLLKSRNRENGRIVKKLERQLRAIQKNKENA
jgi:hypothetical protein